MTQVACVPRMREMETIGAVDRRRALVAVSMALIAGFVTQALFWHAPLGLNWWLLDLLQVGASVWLFRRGPLRPMAWATVAGAILFGASIVLYESEWTLRIALPANVLLLAALPIILRDDVGLGALAGIPKTLVVSLGGAPRAAIDAALLPLDAFDADGRSGLRRALLGLLAGLPVAGVFALLLSADPNFASVLTRLEDKLGTVALFVAYSFVTSAAYVFAHVLHARRDASSIADAPGLGPYRAALSTADAAPSPRVAPLTWYVVMGQVALVFGLFVAANARLLFGGHDLVRAPGTLTYSRYLHAGFYQLLFATILSVCLVLVGHVAMRPRGASAKGAPGGRMAMVLESTLLVLTGVTLASCWQRLQIYQDAYGATYLRLGVAVIELGIFAVLLCTLGKAIFREWNAYGGTVLGSLFGVALMASGLNADAYVARTNLDRAMSGKALDAEYLAGLSPDAAGVLDHPALHKIPALREKLEKTWVKSVRQGDWRSLRGLSHGRLRTLSPS